jgi:signal transduction histidine kinase
VSHEIRTPMTAVLGFTDLLLSELDDPLALESAQTIRRNAEHLLELLNDILDISQIEAAKVEVERTAWSPRDIVDDVVGSLEVRAKAKALTLRAEYAGPLPDTVLIDPARLRQILTNVVGNAVKFTEQGSVRVVTTFTAGADGQSRLRFDVIDTGIGIRPTEIEAIFEPFTQADPSASRRHEGTGLGLAISRQLARALGGDVTVCSGVDQGSTFTLVLPGVTLDELPTSLAPSCEDAR